jgi:hypothetical protein
LQGLLVKEPAKRLDWTAILTHPFWAGKLSHLVRPQTGAAKKSVHQSQTQGRSLPATMISFERIFRSSSSFFAFGHH